MVLCRAANPRSNGFPGGRGTTSLEPDTPQVEVLRPPTTTLQAEIWRAIRSRPIPQFARRGPDVVRVAEHVTQTIALRDSEVRGVGMGDVVVKVDQGPSPRIKFVVSDRSRID